MIKFVSYEFDKGISFGALKEDIIIDLSDVAQNLKEVLIRGPLDRLIDIVENRSEGIDFNKVIFHQVIPNASRIICVGKNYKDHAVEMGGSVPKNINLFIRTSQSLVGHKQSLIKSKVSSHYDYEGELAVIIGKGGRHIREKDAIKHIAGYSCLLDGSMRDFQSHSITAGKNFDSSGSFGPWLMPSVYITDPQNLNIITRINGGIVQRCSTKNMIFPIKKIIAYVSSFTFLNPGDIISTGTPDGVGYGRNPPLWLKDGDLVEVEIDKVGTLLNYIKTEI